MAQSPRSLPLAACTSRRKQPTSRTLHSSEVVCFSFDWVPACRNTPALETEIRPLSLLAPTTTFFLPDISMTSFPACSSTTTPSSHRPRRILASLVRQSSASSRFSRHGVSGGLCGQARSVDRLALPTQELCTKWARAKDPALDRCKSRKWKAQCLRCRDIVRSSRARAAGQVRIIFLASRHEHHSFISLYPEKTREPCRTDPPATAHPGAQSCE